MGASSRYCKPWRINPAGDPTGYERYFVPLAQAYYQKQGLSEAEEVAGDRFQQGIQIALLGCIAKILSNTKCRTVICMFQHYR